MANITAAAGYYNDPAKTAKTFREINGVWCVVPGDYGRIEADGVTMRMIFQLAWDITWPCPSSALTVSPTAATSARRSPKRG